MATRSIIAAEFSPEFGTGIVSTYCHHDGYINGGVGEMLVNEYDCEDWAFEVAQLGYLSSLSDIMEANLKPQANAEEPEYVASVGELVGHAHDCDAEYIYLWKDYQWTVLDVRADMQKKFGDPEFIPVSNYL